MALNESYKQFILDQLSDFGEFETKNMFGGTALLREGKAFAKIKHDKYWLKVDDSNRSDFELFNMQQYTYGKGNSRKLNFFETPVEIIENKDELTKWVNKSIKTTLKK